MTDDLNFMFLTFIGLVIFTGVSIALFVAYKILNKYSNFGDSSCNINEYTRRGIQYERCRDDVDTNAKFRLFADYGVDTYGNRKHKIPEQLLKNADKKTIEDEFDAEMKDYL